MSSGAAPRPDGRHSVRDTPLNAEPPFLTVRAENEKAKRGARLPLRADVATMLKEHLTRRLGTAREESLAAGRPLSERLEAGIPVFTSKPTKREFDKDLAFAGIQKKDRHDRVACLHGLRHTYATNLARAGVPVRIAMDLLRHSDPKLTMAVYSHLEVIDLAEGVAALPDFRSEASPSTAERDQPEHV